MSAYKVQQMEGDIPPITSCHFGSVTKIWDVIIGVTPVTFGGVVGDSQMVKPRKENKEANDDDRNGAIWMLNLYGS